MMKHNLTRKLLSAVCAFALLLSLVPAAYAADGPVKSSNINKQDYSTWSSTVKSYLYDNGHGLTRVEYVSGSVVVEDYDSNFNYLSGRTIPMELSIWGGFYAGSDANYLIFGQTNPSQSNSQEVIRVVKYSKDWVRQGQASLNGANTTVPFDAGSLRCDEYGGYLYIRTCHEMYRSSDGYNHQSNLTMAVKESNMTVSDSYYDVMNTSYGYVSHSFNQFIIVDQSGRIITLDHGDAYPRGIVWMGYYADAGTGKFRGSGYNAWCFNQNLIDFPGAVGNNTTGGSAGGLEETTNSYIMAFNSDGQGGGGSRDIYLNVANKAAGSSKQYKLSNGGNNTTPVLAPLDMTGGYALWNAKNGNQTTDTLYYVAYVDNGAPSSVQQATGSLSDCQPISYNGQVVWYVTNNSEPVFYTLSASGLQSHSVGSGAAPTTPETPETPTQPETPAQPTTPTTPSNGNKWTGIISDGNQYFTGNNAVMADGTLKAWYRADTVSGKSFTEAYDLATMGTGYHSVTPGALLKTNGEASIFDLPNYYSDIFKVGDNVKQISSGGHLLLKNDGSVFALYLPSGDLADDGWSGMAKVTDNAKQVSECDSYNYAFYVLKNDGSLWSWGYGDTPFLGRNQGKTDRAMGKIMDNVAAVAPGMALKTDGSVWCWGEGMTVGNGTDQPAYSPVKVLDNAVGIWSSANGDLHYAVTKDGSLYSWGSIGHIDTNMGLGYSNPDKQMKQSSGSKEWADYMEWTEYYQSTPRKVDIDDAVAVCGYWNLLVVQKSDGSLWAIGSVGDMPCRTVAAGEREIITTFKKFIDGVKVSPNVTGAPATPTTPAEPETPATPEKSSLVTGSLDMPQLSKQEIIDLLAENPLTLPSQVFDSQPSCSAPYQTGKLSNAVLQAALNRLNALRRIAGIPAASLDQSWNESAQYGAVILGSLGTLNHTPSRPSDMDKAFYDKAYAATNSSNLYAGRFLLDAVDGWMDDSDAGNIAKTGHRRWQLSPALSKVGFGAVNNGNGYGSFAVEKVFDRGSGSSSHSVNYDSFGWPSAGNFPNDLSAFTPTTAWSVSLNPSVYAAPSGITVRISGGGKTWTLSGSYTASNAGAYLSVTPADGWNYGNNHNIIFRPDGVTKYEGVYTVEIQGLKYRKDNSNAPFSYTVDFFSTSQSGSSNEPSTPTTPSTNPDNPFTDVPDGAYYTDAVLWAYKNNVTAGTTPTTFSPYATCTRGQVVTFLWRAKGEPEPTTKTNPFRDVKTSDYYYKAVLWAYENGITAGTTTTTFSPGDTCTNGHVVTFLWRSNKKPAASGVSSLAQAYPGQYYTDAVAWADTNGLLDGTGTAFNPASQSPRANIVTYLYRNMAG